MSLYIDHKYIGLVSSRLQKFKRKTDHLYTFRCPFCGDSKKNQNKTRGYLFRKINDMFFLCHNCGRSHTLSNFLKEVDPNLQREYAMERYKNGELGHSNYKKPQLEIDKPQPVTRFNRPDYLQSLDPISTLPEGHYAKDYIENRLIPGDRMSDLYFTEDFKAFVDKLLPENEYHLKRNDPRIVIPFYDEANNLIAIQGRALLDNEMRYITVKIKDVPKIYGLNRIDWKCHIYVVEGPFDSMFLPNCLAGAGADLPKLTKYKDRVTVVYDNEPRNKDIVKRMEKMIASGYAICIWPDNVSQKDINAMVLSDITPDEIRKIIDRSTTKGLSAKIQLQHWRKC